MLRCLVLTALLAVTIVKLAVASTVGAAVPGAAERPRTPAQRQHLVALPPAFASGLYPCSDCHAGMTPDVRRRELRDEHAAIVLRHAAEQLWCLDCHQAQNRDNLRLTTGEPLPLAESYRLCGQCHGEKLQDWRNGLHGKRTGYWNGDQQYLLCTHCHNPHDPEFKPLAPLPPPERPGRAAH